MDMSAVIGNFFTASLNSILIIDTFSRFRDAATAFDICVRECSCQLKYRL